MTGRASVDATLWRPTFGAVPESGGTTFRVWSSAARSVSLVLEGRDLPARAITMTPQGGNFFEASVEGVGAGTLYWYRIDDRGNFPDPASRSLPNGVHGPSEVIDWAAFEWTDDAWPGVSLDRLLIYELHVGTFTPAGSFTAVVDRLPYLAELGVNAIELMPVAAFPGRWNWGYDGVALYAPAAGYGRPDDLRRLVDAAHRVGLAVILDVVYNHLGPDGAYLPAFSPDFFSSRHQSPWGDGVNLDGPGSAIVRQFLLENALHWIREYHVDGLRLDATHALVDDSDRHLVAELAETVHELDLGREVHVIAEDERNDPILVKTRRAGGFGLDAVWADDFHHQLHRALTGESHGYYADYSERLDEAATTIDEGWFYTGQHSTFAGRPRGGDPRGIERKRFVFCLQNHDQVGNRAMGERLEHLAALPACRAAAAILLLAPETPLLFMGQEWAASTPFLYFTDHQAELGRLVTEGRWREFRHFAAFSEPGAANRIPDPQATVTFESSRLRWDEIENEPHRSVLQLYRALIALRPGWRRTEEARHVARAVDPFTLAMVRSTEQGPMLVVARLSGAGTVGLPDDIVAAFGSAGSRCDCETALTTEEWGFAADRMAPRLLQEGPAVSVRFLRPSAIVLRRQR